jgi:septum formation topological specificity factor MinE
MQETLIRIISAEYNGQEIIFNTDVISAIKEDSNYNIKQYKKITSIPFDIISDEITIMPSYRDNYCCFIISSFRTYQEYLPTLQDKLNEIVKLYIQSKIEEVESEILKRQNHLKELNKNLMKLYNKEIKL